jgi:branched-chain amino acid transport system permease protein
MIEAIIAGCALGAVYALASGGLVITYVSSGILNVAYPAIAFFVARFYYFLHLQPYWGIQPGAGGPVLCVPALGYPPLEHLLFRFCPARVAADQDRCDDRRRFPSRL